MGLFNFFKNFGKKKQTLQSISTVNNITNNTVKKDEPIIEKKIEEIEEKKKEIIKSTVDEIMNTTKQQINTNNTLFDKILPLILKYEGGYVNDPNDPGGETNKGITKEVYDTYRNNKKLKIRSVKEITDEEVKDIYYNYYWLKGSCDKLSNNLAIIHFDTCVNAGITQAARFLQRCCGVKDDGIIGPMTLKSIEARDENNIVDKYISLRTDFYKNIAITKPYLSKFLKGWLKRVDNLALYIKDNNKITIT